MSILTAKGIVRTFGELRVLSGLDISIEEAEFVAITGKSGSGKSTLFGILGTHDLEYSGQLFFKNSVIGDMNHVALAELRRNRIGFVFQDFHLLPNLTAFENVLLPAVFSGTVTDEVVKRVRDILAILEIRADCTPSVLLSRGERQRVAVARGLVSNPDILLADEPSASLDENSEDVLFDLLDRLRKERGFAIAAVVHSSRVLERADRVLHLENGVLHEVK